MSKKLVGDVKGGCDRRKKRVPTVEEKVAAGVKMGRAAVKVGHERRRRKSWSAVKKIAAGSEEDRGRRRSGSRPASK
jgi:hypothetical protein